MGSFSHLVASLLNQWDLKRSVVHFVRVIILFIFFLVLDCMSGTVGSIRHGSYEMEIL